MKEEIYQTIIYELNEKNSIKETSRYTPTQSCDPLGYA